MGAKGRKVKMRVQRGVVHAFVDAAISLMPARDAIGQVSHRLREICAVHVHVPNDERDHAQYEKYVAHRSDDNRGLVRRALRHAVHI
jgi:hypothetical protein